MLQMFTEDKLLNNCMLRPSLKTRKCTIIAVQREEDPLLFNMLLNSFENWNLKFVKVIKNFNVKLTTFIDY